MSDDSKKYNGYTNYETWAVYAAITNNESLYNSWMMLARDLRTREKEENLAIDLKNHIKNQCSLYLQEVPILPKLFIEPLLMGAIEEVNFIEVANSLLEDIVDEAALKNNE